MSDAKLEGAIPPQDIEFIKGGDLYKQGKRSFPISAAPWRDATTQRIVAVELRVGNYAPAIVPINATACTIGNQGMPVQFTMLPQGGAVDMQCKLGTQEHWFVFEPLHKIQADMRQRDPHEMEDGLDVSRRFEKAVKEGSTKRIRDATKKPDLPQRMRIAVEAEKALDRDLDGDGGRTDALQLIAAKHRSGMYRS